MREVIYLSEGKLREFLPEPRRALPAVSLHAGLPFAGMDVATPTSNNAQDLRRHLKRVEKTLTRKLPHYTEANIDTGSWVKFETRLNWVTLRDRYRDLVLFVDSELNHETGGPRRLLLHGSARHLLGRPPVQVDGPALTGLEGGGHSAGTIFVTNAGHVVNALAHSLNELGPEAGEGAEPLPEATAPLHRKGLRDLLAALDAEREHAEVRTSAVVTGLARVSAVLEETSTEVGCMVASPLVVEYVKQRA
ncbi:SAVMC3_10250 family protein [Streptomyces sp. CBMA123]|uniref:SAVMC3_10250 family protein n=1 Tax=Streptomyces sp. CBMA123 TaxID=1896313 RepID=UPI001661D506|nr:SAVMC3_10250 family protein [Streptomyces sp. CBMA123]MBD0689956.1 hypothetical protein [Streptomyces sp. CBMA123]